MEKAGRKLDDYAARNHNAEFSTPNRTDRIWPRSSNIRAPLHTGSRLFEATSRGIPGWYGEPGNASGRGMSFVMFPLVTILNAMVGPLKD